MPTPSIRDEAVIDRICDRLAAGKSLSVICKGKGMPDRRTVQRWLQGDDELAARLLEARETGFEVRAERVLEDVRKIEDPNRARVVLAAEQWYLGKLSNGFRERPVSGGTVINVDAGNAFAAIAGALEIAAAGIAGRSSSTRSVVIDGTAGPADATGRLADMAGDGGERLGEDSGRE